MSFAIVFSLTFMIKSEMCHLSMMKYKTPPKEALIASYFQVFLKEANTENFYLQSLKKVRLKKASVAFIKSLGSAKTVQKAKKKNRKSFSQRDLNDYLLLDRIF